MAWLTAWTYRKAIVIAHTDDAAQTNYQLKLLVGESSGAVGEQVDCGGLVASDFDDLRFTTSDGTTLCDYWIESLSGTTPNQLATVWIEVPSIAAHPNDTTIYMYYGGTTTAVSSGANTFIVFDDFERGNDGDTIGGSWTEASAHVHISTEQEYTGIAANTRSVKLVGADAAAPYATIPVTAGSTIAIRARYYKETALQLVFLHGDSGSGNHMQVQFDSSENVNVYDGTSYVDTTLNSLADSWGLVEFNNFNWGAATCTIVVDGNAKTGVDISYAFAPMANKLAIYGQANTGLDDWVDDLLVRNFTVNEPTWSSFGGMEAQKSVGGGSMAISSTLNRLISKGVGSGSLGISGALSGVKTFFASVGAGTMNISGALSTVKKMFQSVGNGSMTISSTLNRLISKSVGAGTMNIAGTLSSAKTFFQSVGNGVLSISSILIRNFQSFGSLGKRHRKGGRHLH